MTKNHKPNQSSSKDGSDKVELAANAAESILGPNPFISLNKRDFLDAWSKLADQVIKQPATLAKHHTAFLQEIAKAFIGYSEKEPARGDRRFKDKAWSENPIYRTYMQGYLAWVDTLNNWVDDLGLDRKNRERSHFFLSLLTDTFVATNTLIGNPAALRKLVDTKGQSTVQGMKHLIHDMKENDFMPSQVDKSKFTVGENVATTPGAVVYQSDLLELIQYQPQTSQVAKIPILIVPPQINKYYVFDLSPEKSLIKFLVESGFQVFAISWFNPTPTQRKWGLNDYVEGVEAATDAIIDITRSRKINLFGACAGGITTSIAAAHLAAQGDNRLNTLTLLVSVLDMAATKDTSMGMFLSDETIQLAKDKSQSAGVLEGSEMARVFAWLRPNDLIWSYWVNNYLLGNDPPAFDILYWNNDTTRLPAGLHSEFLDMFSSNPLTTSGELEVIGTPIDLNDIKADIFLLGGVSDHITPWKATYRSCGMFGGDVEYVLSNSGHVQSILNPPGNPKATYFVCEETPETAEAYLESAQQQEGSWWEHWNKWLGERSGARKKAPAKLGNKNYPAGEAAPGTYVHMS